ncbi:MAG: hypothetical protein PF487_02125 [Bacteroidales bacterium]|nr:hypothetical protein [Bacteroidales bacterium]
MYQTKMNKPRTIITSIGDHGEKIVTSLKKHCLLEVDFMSQNELIEDSSKNMFLLFIIYSPTDNCIEKVNEIARLYTNKTVIEIIITDRIERKNPHYIINNLSIDDAIKEVSTLIKAFTDLGKFPSQASIDMADIIDSLKNVSRLQMKEFTLETNGDYNAFSQFFQRTTEKIKTVWIQIYLPQNDNSLPIVLEKLFDAVSSNLGSETDILWNVSYGEPLLKEKENKYVLIYC